MRNLVYILTDDSLVIAHASYKPPCCACGCTTGTDYMELSYSAITDVAVNNAGQGCGCCQVPVVQIMAPSLAMMAMNRRSNTASLGYSIYAENPDEVANILRKLRKGAVTNVNVIAQAPTAITMPSAPEKRVFVALAAARTAFQVIVVSSSSMDAFKAQVQEKFGLKGDVRFELDGVGVAVGSISEVQNNDKLIAFTE